MSEEGLQALRRKLIEAIEAATPDDGLLRTGTGVAFWRERTFLSIAPILEEAIRTTYREAIEEAAKVAESWGASDDEPTDPDVAFSCLAAAIRALVRRGETEGEGT